MGKLLFMIGTGSNFVVTFDVDIKTRNISNTMILVAVVFVSHGRELPVAETVLKATVSFGNVEVFVTVGIIVVVMLLVPLEVMVGISVAETVGLDAAVFSAVLFEET